MKKLMFLITVMSVLLAASLAWATWGIEIVKECVSPEEADQPINYTVTVTNTGTHDLEVTVTDVTLDRILWGPGMIEHLGGYRTIIFSDYPIGSECGGAFTNTVEAVGYDPQYNVTVKATDTATCSVPCEEPEPCIAVTKECTNARPGEPIEYAGTVSNCGNVDLMVTLNDLTFGATIIQDLLLTEGSSAGYSFTYQLEDCGEGVPNVVEALGSYTLPGGATASVSAIASATCLMECDEGCTLTPGYWKTHSIYGPAPYDGTWANIGENTAFFLSGKSYYGALWTSSSGGNAYYILAHAYIAAELNVYNGASVPAEVQEAFDDATALLSTYSPSDSAVVTKKSPVRADFIELAGILDLYNNGLIGPGHCPD